MKFTFRYEQNCKHFKRKHEAVPLEFWLKYNIGDTTAMNTMLSTCNTEGGCIPHITNMINSTTMTYKDKIIFLV